MNVKATITELTLNVSLNPKRAKIGGAQVFMTRAAAALASAVQMNGWHALALVACGVWGRGVFTNAAGVCFALGVLLFCGSIYAGFAGVALGPVTPVGGGLLMLGWLALGLSALRR